MGGVNGERLFTWAEAFVEHVRDSTAGSRKLLFIFEEYWSRMSIHILHLLSRNRFIECAIREHTSRMTQLCDVRMFGAFKNDLTI